MNAWSMAAVLIVGGSAWAQAPDGGVETAIPGEPTTPAQLPMEAEPAPLPEKQNAVPVRRPSLLERITPEGYAKLVGTLFVSPSSGDALVGGRSGFRLSSVRLALRLDLAEHFNVVASIDGAVPKRSSVDPLDGSRVVDLKDAYIRWSMRPWATLQLGQFKPPYNAESLLPDGSLPFITRSVISDGVNPPEHVASVRGLSLDRQIGVQLSSARLGSDFGIRYAVAVVNGNGPNTLNNDNGAVTPVGRLGLEYKDLIALGVNGYFNPVTEGVRPNRLNSEHLGMGADLSLNIHGFDVLAVALMRQTTHPGSGLPTEQALGLMGSIHYLHVGIGLEAGIRVAHDEPNSTAPDDRLIEMAAMVGYRFQSVPLRLVAQYSLRLEEPTVSILNDTVDVLAQVNW